MFTTKYFLRWVDYYLTNMSHQVIRILGGYKSDRIVASSGMSLESQLQNYLEGRSQRVKVDYMLSKPSNIISDVPQGALLRSLLYTLYTSNLHNSFELCKSHFYALYFWSAFRTKKMKNKFIKILVPIKKQTILF